jgi:YihY family inner membrane protein
LKNDRTPGSAVRGPAVGRRFAVAVVRRYWDADGPSHTRALGYHSALVLLAGFIGFIGLASVLNVEVLRGTAEQMVTSLSPGPAGRVLQEAAQHGARGGAAAMVLGLGTALTVGTRAMRQVERAANRMAAIERDRDLLRRYGVAFLLMVSAGLLITGAALLIAGGQAVARGAALRGSAEEVWAVARWPVGGLLSGAAIFLIYRTAPRERRWPTRTLVHGTLAALTLWIVFTLLLTLYFSVSEKATQTYGPLVGIVALIVWCGLSALAVNLGLAVMAELEERRGSSKRSAD